MIEHRHQGKRSAPCERCGQPAKRHRAARPEHAPEGDPCKRCGEPASAHRSRRERAERASTSRPEHAPQGDPCYRCGKAASDHRAPRKRSTSTPRKKAPRLIVGIDGEGYDRHGRHVYSYLAAVDEHGNVLAEAREQRKGDGLTHEQCVELLLSLPSRSLVFGFSIGYDVTKILEGLPPSVVYRILRPELRKVRRCNVCRTRWKNVTLRACPQCGQTNYREHAPRVEYGRYGYSWGPFGVARKGWERRAHPHDEMAGARVVRERERWYETDADGTKRAYWVTLPASRNAWVPIRWGWRRKTRVWDCFKFFQTSFVEALKLWDIGTPEQRARIQSMKNQRGAFSRVERSRIESYCREECHLLAQLMRRMLGAHVDTGLALRRYDGPGSTASALLNHHDVVRYSGPRLARLAPELQRAVMSAYFGGRFENSVIGRVEKTIHGADINAAYPYALTFMPCLAHGKWKRVTGDIRAHAERATVAICRFRVRDVSEQERRALAWAPLLCRDKDGRISAGTNFSGWAYWQELAPALRHWPDLVELGGEAWIYTSRCTERPFGWMPQNYRERCEWGASGRGIVRKLGDNSCYGKLAQSKGENPKFQNWIWAGMCTATTRGQLLDAIASARDPWDVLSVATDGITALRPLRLPAPLDTGTADCTSKGKPKVFGAWDVKRIEGGGLYVKPGMFIPLSDSEGGELRARGIGRRELAKSRALLLDAWEAWDRSDYSDDARVPIVARRFYGAKTSITVGYRCKTCRGFWPGIPSQGCQTRDCPRFGAVGTDESTTSRRAPVCSPACEEKRRAARRAGREYGGCGRLIVTTAVDHAGAVERFRVPCRAQLYGTWGAHTMNIAFDPFPKREREIAKRGAVARLYVRDLGGVESAAYVAGVTTPEGEAARADRELAEWQHDGDGGEVLEAAE